MYQYLRTVDSTGTLLSGVDCFKAGDYISAFEMFSRGSKEGNACAQFNRALCYELGKGTTASVEKVRVVSVVKNRFKPCVVVPMIQ